MQEQRVLSAWWEELRDAFGGFEWAAMLRSTLFLTCLTATLNHYRLFDWVDVLALKFLPETAFEQAAPQRAGAMRTLVLGITPDLFEQRFGGHTPINRDRFQHLIEAVLVAYPNLHVLAIDYDLSPGSGKPCDRDSEDSVCDIAELESQQQARFEEFLEQRFALKEGAAGRAECRPQLVLITPLKTPEEHSDLERNWLQRDASSCVRFAQHFLANHNWLETVVKHRSVPWSGDACEAEEDPNLPLALVVNKARMCAGVLKPLAPPQAESVELINFAHARAAVFTCALWQWEDIGAGCARRMQMLNAVPADIDTVFVGSAYGQEDLFRTPLGDQYGVELHAFGAHSQFKPLDEPKALSFGIDIAIGLISALLFQTLWGGAQRYSLESAQRFFFIAAVFAVLALAAWAALRCMPWMLQRGFWMNPFMILVGLFVDGYAGAIERVHRRAQESAQTVINAPARSAIAEAALVFAGRPALTDRNDQRIFRFCKKVLIYWVVVALGLFFTFLAV